MRKSTNDGERWGGVREGNRERQKMKVQERAMEGAQERQKVRKQGGFRGRESRLLEQNEGFNLYRQIINKWFR